MKVWRNIHHGGKRMEGASVSGKREEDMMDFSVNVTPLGIPENIQKAMQESLSKAGWYPDDSKYRLKQALSERHNVPLSKICVGNGASDLIYRTVFALKPKKALVLAPTFAEYESALACVDATVSYYRMNHEDFDVKADLLKQMDDGVDMVFLCNPNNPTGRLIEKALVLAAADRCEAIGAWLVVDECFLEFVRHGEDFSMTGHLSGYSRLLILKSFTKMFGIAGLRLGYLLCGPEGLADRIDKAGCNWNVNCVAEAAGLEALRSQAYEKQVLDYVEAERKWLYERLSGMGFRVIPGQANYLLFEVLKNTGRKSGSCEGHEREPLGAWLLRRGIMIRSCDDYENLDGNFYRIGINTHESNEQLIIKIGEWLS
jgi:threonine-phosphate decarboxylase